MYVKKNWKQYRWRKCWYCFKTCTKKNQLISKWERCSTHKTECSNMLQLKQQMSKHSNEQQFTCSTCKKIFLSKSGIKHHIQTHQTDRKVFNCSYNTCKKIYLSLSSLIKHLKTNLDSRPQKMHISLNNCFRNFV